MQTGLKVMRSFSGGIQSFLTRVGDGPRWLWFGGSGNLILPDAGPMVAHPRDA